MEDTRGVVEEHKPAVRGATSRSGVSHGRPRGGTANGLCRWRCRRKCGGDGGHGTGGGASAMGAEEAGALGVPGAADRQLRQTHRNRS